MDETTTTSGQAQAGENSTQTQATGATATAANSTATTTQTPSTTQAPDQTTQQTQQTQQTAQAEPVIPDGYVKAEDVETERTARTAAETARIEAETARTSAEARARALEIQLAAQSLGFADVKDAEKFIEKDVADIPAALAAVLEAKPYLKGEAKQPVTPTSPANAARTNSQAPIFTQAQISDRAFWAANKPAILQAMKEGRIQG
jgi:hypothetical protein